MFETTETIVNLSHFWILKNTKAKEEPQNPNKTKNQHCSLAVEKNYKLDPDKE